jgi:5-(carboxyamino)imidazole ribonucleotide synthase
MKCVGIVGGGQLARMLAIAGTPLNLRFAFLDPSGDACAAPLGTYLKGAYDDSECLSYIAEHADVVTYEFENVPNSSVQYLSSHVPVFPSPDALAIARDRLNEKNLFTQLAVPTVPYEAVNSLSDLKNAVEKIGFPSILKTRVFGYDGKGQRILYGAEDIAPAWNEYGGVPMVLERLVDFDRELSCIAVRARNGKTEFYPPSENVHQKGILRVAWSRPEDEMTLQIQEYTLKVLDKLDYVGVLAIEFFQVGNMLLANEIAPRVHNSGHWTIEGAQTSQFENHLRAILGLPLGATEAVGFTAMINCIGQVPDMEAVMSIPGAHFHWYGKKLLADRKVGHITIRSDDQDKLETHVNQLLQSMIDCG